MTKSNVGLIVLGISIICLIFSLSITNSKLKDAQETIEVLKTEVSDNSKLITQLSNQISTIDVELTDNTERIVSIEDWIYSFNSWLMGEDNE